MVSLDATSVGRLSKMYKIELAFYFHCGCRPLRFRLAVLASSFQNRWKALVHRVDKCNRYRRCIWISYFGRFKNAICLALFGLIIYFCVYVFSRTCSRAHKLGKEKWWSVWSLFDYSIVWPFFWWLSLTSFQPRIQNHRMKMTLIHATSNR